MTCEISHQSVRELDDKISGFIRLVTNTQLRRTGEQLGAEKGWRV